MRTQIEKMLTQKGRRVHSVTPRQSVTDAVNAMNDLRIGALAVLEERRLVGIITERDVLQRLVAARRDPDATTVGQIMTDRVATLEPSATVEQAMRVMQKVGCRHLPIMEDGELVGLISVRDCANWAVREHQQEIEQLIGYVTRRYPN